MQIQNPHDKIFKETFSNVDVAKAFITHFLPPSVRNTIVVASIQPQKDSFISRDLQEYFSDLLFQTKIHNKPAYVYFLFEHKSYHDCYTALQLLRYMVEIWETKRDNKEKRDCRSSCRLFCIMAIQIGMSELRSAIFWKGIGISPRNCRNSSLIMNSLDTMYRITKMKIHN